MAQTDREYQSDILETADPNQGVNQLTSLKNHLTENK